MEQYRETSAIDQVLDVFRIVYMRTGIYRI